MYFELRYGSIGRHGAGRRVQEKHMGNFYLRNFFKSKDVAKGNTDSQRHKVVIVGFRSKEKFMRKFTIAIRNGHQIYEIHCHFEKHNTKNFEGENSGKGG